MAHDKVFGICENKCLVETVPKKGGEFTGTLTIDKSGGNEYLVLKRNDLPEDAEINGYWNCPRITWRDSGNNEFAYVHSAKDTVSNRVFLGVARIINGEKKYSEVSVRISPEGVAYTSAPTPSSATDSSTKVATTQWVNNIDNDVVHKSRNETIYGVKTFTSNLHIDQSASGGDGAIELTGKWPYIDLHRDNRADLDYTARIWNNLDGRLLIKVKNVSTSIETNLEIVSTDDGKRIVYIPSTPSEATSNEIATADWVIDKVTKRLTLETTKISTSSGLQLTNVQAGDMVFCNVDVGGAEIPLNFIVPDSIGSDRCFVHVHYAYDPSSSVNVKTRVELTYEGGYYYLMGHSLKSGTETEMIVENMCYGQILRV